MTKEFTTIHVSYKKDKHKKKSYITDFEEQVNEHLKQGWSIINCNNVNSQFINMFTAFLVRDV